MITTKKKPNIIMIVLGALASAFLGYLVAGAWREGIEFHEFLERFTIVCSYPLHDYYNEFTFRMIGYALLVYAVIIVMYYTSQRNLMPGKEYGTSKLADIRQVNHALADKDEGRNRILSQNVRMSLDTRRTKLNNNVLIIGGSGAGKTFYEVKPNLMQLNTSFILTDPKGGARRSHLKRVGKARI